MATQIFQKKATFEVKKKNGPIFLVQSSETNLR